MNNNEKMNGLFKLRDLVQKYADKEGCQHCLDLLESVFKPQKRSSDKHIVT